MRSCCGPGQHSFPFAVVTVFVKYLGLLRQGKHLGSVDSSTRVDEEVVSICSEDCWFRRVLVVAGSEVGG